MSGELISLEEAKLHCKVDIDDDDSLIQIFIDVALESAANYLNRPVPWEEGSPAEPVFPASVKAACLLHIGDLYIHREAQVLNTVLHTNPAYYTLLTPYRLEMGIW